MNFLEDLGDVSFANQVGDDDRPEDMGGDSDTGLALFDDIKAADRMVAVVSGKAGSGKVAELDLSDLGFTVAPKKTMKFSDQQVAIFEEFANPESGHVTIIARAGSSKTTTSIEGGKHAFEESIMYCAFGKDIAAELNEKIELLGRDGVEAKTTHSMGCRFISKARPFMEIEPKCGYARAEKAVIEFFGRKQNQWDTEAKTYCEENLWHVEKLVSLTKIMKPYVEDVQEIWDIAVDMGFATTAPPPKGQPPRPENKPKVIDQVCEVAMLVINKLIEEALRHKSIKININFDDMIFLPVRCGWVYPVYELVIIDEAQDLSFTQIELATLACSGRIFIVGDDRQAIYGWRGADSGSIQRMTDYLESKVMYLTTCYRCAKKIIKEAQFYVPDIQAWENSPEGEVHNIPQHKLASKVKIGDMVISRANAPLMGICLKLIAKGIRAKMAGNDVGLEMLRIIEKVEGKGKNCVPFADSRDMWNRLLEWGKKEKESLEEMVRRKFMNAKEERIKQEIERRVETLRDKLQMFQVMLTQLGSPDEVKRRMMSLFEEEDEEGNIKKTKGNDRSKYVLCTSVHKAKGLECENAFVLAWTLRTRDEEELNICYVAVTRAKLRLYYVHEKNVAEQEYDEDVKEIASDWHTRHRISANAGRSNRSDADDREHAQGDVRRNAQEARGLEEQQYGGIERNQGDIDKAFRDRRSAMSHDDDFLNQMDKERGRRY